MKLFYYITMSLITICIVLNIFHLIHPDYQSIFLSGMNVLSPVAAFIYLLTVFMKRKRLLKKIHGPYEKFFSKN
jgi:hypothetical protein